MIIPTYNCRAYIKQALESIFAQTYASYEIIVIDDGSTDDTSVILAPFQHRIRYFYQENAGVSVARNRGLQQARGEFIVFLDADDFFLPTKLADQMALLDENSSVDYVHSGSYLVDEFGEVIEIQEPWHKAPQLDLEAWLIHPPPCLHGILMRRNWVQRVGGFDPSLAHGEDTALYLQLALLGWRGIWLKRPTVCYRQHSGNATRNARAQAKSRMRIMDDFFRRDDLPLKIRALEQDVLFGNLMWSVWDLFRTNYVSDIADYLARTKCYMEFEMDGNSSERTIIRWFCQLLAFCRTSSDHKATDLQALLPIFHTVIQTDEAQWRVIERKLNWLLTVESRMQHVH